MKYPPALTIGSDASMFDPSGDAAKRMESYVGLYEEVHVLVAARSIPSEAHEVRPKVFVHPVSYRHKVLGLFALWRKGRRLMNEHAFCVLYAQDPFWFGLVGLILARTQRIPLAVGVYGTDIANKDFVRESFMRRVNTILAPFIFRRADAIQTDGPETVERLTAHFGPKVFFKPMFPSNRGELSELSRHVPPKPFSLLFVARFAPQKNLPLLADVIEAMAKKLGERVHFTLAGGGPLKEGFLETLERRGLKGNVVDAGVLSRTQILDAYASHHALILTSFYEGFPRVFMEAALAGMPILTADVGGVQDLVLDGVTGRVFPQGTSPSVWADAIATLAASPEKVEAMSRAVKAQFETMYGGKSILDYQRPLADFLASKA